MFAIPERGGQWLRNVHLNSDEIKKIIEKAFDTDQLNQVRTFFYSAFLLGWLTLMYKKIEKN